MLEGAVKECGRASIVAGRLGKELTNLEKGVLLRGSGSFIKVDRLFA